jgi:hypothetical protein
MQAKFKIFRYFQESRIKARQPEPGNRRLASNQNN